MPPSICILAIILLTIFVEEGLTRGGRGGGVGGGRGGGRGVGRSGGASYRGPGGYSGSGTGRYDDGTGTAIAWGVIAGGVIVAFLLCLVVSCIRKGANWTCKANCFPIFKTKDAYQRDGKPIKRRGIPLNYPKSAKAGTTNSSAIKKNSINSPYAGKTWSTNSSAINKDWIHVNAAYTDNTGSTNFSEPETESNVGSISRPPSYHTIDKLPPPPYSIIDEEILIYVQMETETNQPSESIVSLQCKIEEHAV